MVRRAAFAIVGITILSPAISYAYYEESLSPGGTEIEIIDQNLPVPSTEIEVRELPPPGTAPVVQASPAVQRIHRAPTKSGVSYIGSGGSNKVLVSGKANGLPMNLALPLIVPKGWNLNFKGDAGEIRISYSALKKPWTAVLEEISSSSGSPMTVNWKTGTVTIDASGGKSMSSVLHETSPAAQVHPNRIRKAIIDTPGRADAVARRYKINVDDFCQWNQCGPSAWFPAGYEILLEKPPVGMVFIANMDAGPHDPMAGKKLPPIQEGQAIHTQGTGKTRTPIQTGVKAAQASYWQPDSIPPTSSMPVVRNAAYETAAEELAAGDYIFALTPGPMYQQLAKWCAKAGYELVWKVGGDYTITSFSAFGPDFKNSLVQLFDSLMEIGQPLRATVYERNHIVEVTGE